MGITFGVRFRSGDPNKLRELENSYVQACSRLAESQAGRMKCGNLRALAEEGWTASDVCVIADSWPTLSSRNLGTLLSYAQELRKSTKSSAAEAATWTHAFLEGTAAESFAQRSAADTEIVANGLDRNNGGSVTMLGRLAHAYVTAARSSTLGLLAASAGLSLADTAQRAGHDLLVSTLIENGPLGADRK